MDKTSLGDRMKKYYEQVWNYRLPMRMPVIIRLDGKAFHTFTAKFDRPFDSRLIDAMNYTALYLCEKIQGAQIAYIQSDEISILLHNYKKLNSDAWFNNEVQKMVSVSAGMASAYFSKQIESSLPVKTDSREDLAVFDSRAFVLPENEVCNYFHWRQTDWERNSIQMLSQSLYSHEELINKNMTDMQEICFQKGKNWNDLDTHLKRGRCVIKVTKPIATIHTTIDGVTGLGHTIERDIWIIDNDIPIFSKDRNYIEKHLAIEEE